MKNWFKKNIFLIIFSIIFCGLAYWCQYYETENEIPYSYILYYIALSSALSLLPDLIILKQIKNIIGLPITIFMLSAPLIEVFFFSMFAFVFPFVLMKMLLDIIPITFLNISLNSPTKLYLVLVLGIIFITLFCEKTIKIMNKIMNYDKSNQRINSNLDLALSLANKNKVRFVIYFSFFIYLLIFSIERLNNIQIFETEKFNFAVFYSFATYIAFERILHNLKLMQINPKLFYSKLYKVWDSHGFFDKFK